jgi:outer membrane protein TolC
VLSAEDAVLTARRSLAEIEARRFMLDIQLVRALGGGFQPTLQTSGTR